MSIRNDSVIGGSGATGSGGTRVDRLERMFEADPPPPPASPAIARNGNAGNPGNKPQHSRRAGRHRQRLRLAAQLAHQRDVGGALGAALGHHDAGGGRNQHAGICDTSPSPARQRRELAAASENGMPIADQSDHKAADDVDPVMISPAMASPRTNFAAPSIEP